MLENESEPEGADTQDVTEVDEGIQARRVAVISGMTLSPACMTSGKYNISGTHSSDWFV